MIPYSRLMEFMVPVGQSVFEIPAPRAGTITRWGINQNDGPKDGFAVTLWNADPADFAEDWHEAGRPPAARGGKAAKAAPRTIRPKASKVVVGVGTQCWEPIVALIQLTVPAGSDQAADDQAAISYVVATLAGEGRRATKLWAMFDVLAGTGEGGQAPRPIQIAYTVVPTDPGI